MSKNFKDFHHLGLDYQLRLVAQMLTDSKFANSIMDIISPNYFDDQYIRIVVAEIKDAFQKHDSIPDINSLHARLMQRVDNQYDKQYLTTQITKIKEANLNDTPWIQDTAMKFCKQQELKKSIAEIQKIIDRGELDEYDKCEEIMKKALDIGDNKDTGVDVFFNIDDVLSNDFRTPIPTGIKGLDEIMNGGLAKTELGIVLAPFGVGKTTMITKIANSAMNLGYNVLQIFFEDNVKVIQRKHLSCWTNIELNELPNHADEVKAVIEEKKKGGGILKLKKFPSDGITIPIIRQYLRKLIASGFKPDMILLDYIDCVQPSRRYDDSNVAEGSVMRQFESMLAEFDIAGWTAIQGNRSSIKSEVVESDQMGGSIKKGQIGHFLISIARTNEQKDSGHATLAILKSRFGRDGIVLYDCIFDNSRIQIEVTDQDGGKTFLQTATNKRVADQERINTVLQGLNRANELGNQ